MNEIIKLKFGSQLYKFYVCGLLIRNKYLYKTIFIELIKFKVIEINVPF
jgi:hypothetical protein